jgi:hypothetical protein
MSKPLTLVVLFLIPLASAWSQSPQDAQSPQDPLAPLELVEKDQTGGTRSSNDIFNRNLVLNAYRNLTDVSSYKRGRFGFYAHDGDPRSHWALNPEETEGVIEISWGLAVPIDQVKVEEFRAGNIESFTLELYNGTAWETIDPDHVEKRSLYNFALRSASALRISIKTNGEEAGVSEVEVFNTQSDQPLARYGSDALIAAMKESSAVILFDGSPYLFSRVGRELIRPKYAETNLTNLWTEPVLESVVTHLGGTFDKEEDGPLQVRLNGQAFSCDAEISASVVAQLEVLAKGAGLEFMQRAHLVMIGQGLEALDRADLLAELEMKLGKNPYWLSTQDEGELDAVVTPTLNPQGITYEWAGFRSTAIPDTGIDGWLKYAGTKSVRTWRHAPKYMNMYIRPKERVETEEDFERYRDQVRNSSGGDRATVSAPDDIVAFRAFLNKHDAEIRDEFETYKALGIEVINATGPKNWPNTHHDDFINWASTYMMTYYLAKNFGVEVHQFGNEPDWYFDQIPDEQIQRRLTLIADAVHTAIEDVNRDHGLGLTAIFSAPVLAGNFTGRNARIMMRNLYSSYDGTKTEKKRFNLFNRHRYSGRPYQNAFEVREAKKMMMEEAGEVLPQVFTELNYSTARHWRRPETTFTNDTPSLIAAMASVWGWMMEEQGVYGIFVFKLNDPSTWFWKETDRFSNTITYSMHREMDPGTEPKEREQVVYGTKNFEVCRLFSKGFHGSRPLLETKLQSSDPQYRSWMAEDKSDKRFYIWSVQNNEFENYDVEFDLSQLELPIGALVTVEAVSGARHGEITERILLPEDQKIRIRQAPQSAVLLTIHKDSLAGQIVYAKADATVVQGVNSKRNFGDEPLLAVGRHSNADNNKISLLKFDLPEGEGSIQRSILELHGKSESIHAYDGGFLFRVYAVKHSDWEEGDITAENAPYLYRTVSSLKEVDLEHYPVGHATSFNTPSTMMIDLTQAVQEAREEGRGEINLVVIREVHWPSEDTDNISARFAAREAAAQISPKVYFYSNLSEAGK